MNDHPLFPEVDAEIAAETKAEEERQLRRYVIEKPKFDFLGMEMEFEFVAEGWTYCTEDSLDDGDARKLDHFACKDGEVIWIDWTPYDRMSAEAFCLWLALGQPSRQGGGPLNDRHLMHLAKCKMARADQ